MTDVVVRIDIDDQNSEAKLFAAIDEFAMSKRGSEPDNCLGKDAPDIMIKTVSLGEFIQKKIIFQAREDAEAFMYFWRRMQLVA